MRIIRFATPFSGRLLALGLVLSMGVACGGNPPPVPPPTVPTPATPPSSQPQGPVTRPVPPAPPDLPPPVPPMDDPSMTARRFDAMTPPEINAESPLKPVFFAYDSDALDDEARQILSDNAAVLTEYSDWVITIEGHCDERGTPEYNLALGDRRALAAKTYLQSLGISADRLSTVSYGKEFPFDPGHDEQAWSLNRRAHLMVTATR